MFHVALLRGINVGGNNIIPMAALAKTFERMKLASVRTYIASGNVIFDAPKQDLRKLEQKIEKQLAKDFSYDAKVVVKSKAELGSIIDSMPSDWRKPAATSRYYVIFLRHAIDSKRLLDELPARTGVETLAYCPGALLWAAKKAELGKSTVSKKLLVKSIYQEVTVRNLNTTMKLAELME
jgi:uncharacterized protein (DUF1697 family)